MNAGVAERRSYRRWEPSPEGQCQVLGENMQVREIVVFKLHTDFFKAFSPSVPQRLVKYL